MTYTAILQDMVLLLQEHQTAPTNAQSGKEVLYEMSIKDHYSAMKAQGFLEDFHQYLYREFHNEADVYTLLLSILYKSTQEEYCLKAALEFLIEGKTDLFQSIGIRHQIEYGIFTNSTAGQNYELRRRVHRVQLKQLEDRLGLNYPYIPWNERNENRIIVVTNQLLTVQHAPTRNVFELCSALMDMGKEVVLIVAHELTDKTYLSQSWCKPNIMNYIEDYNKNFIMDYFSHDIRGYQILLHNNSLDEMRNLLNDIYSLKPQMVWHMGGTSLFADLLRNATTVISMPFSIGFTISEAPILLELEADNKKENQAIKQYITERRQVPLPFTFHQVIRPSVNNYSRQDFNLPEDAFLVAIVGNRLDDELSESFISVMGDILEISPKLRLVFIGKMSKEIATLDKDRCSYLGLQRDLMGVLGLMNTFLNPPRKGGGTGALWSLYKGVPVITLDDCDVAGYVKEEFLCADINVMVDRVRDYIEDEGYYQQHRCLAKQYANEIEEKNNLPKCMEKLLDVIEAIVLDNEKLLQ